MLTVDHRALVSQADLIYQSPVVEPLEGQPLGNGTMGTLVWTTPGAIHFQLNRCDVFAVNKHHAGDQAGPADYGGACARIAVELEGAPFGGGEAFAQRLSLADAEIAITGKGVRARCFVSAVSDLLVLEVDDQRSAPGPVRVTVFHWRPPVVETGEHLARREFRPTEGRVCLVQRFDEGEHCSASAVAAQMAGSAISFAADGSQMLIAPPTGKTTLLVSSAASLSGLGQTDSNQGAGNPEVLDGVEATALRVLQEAEPHSYEMLRTEHVRWWERFWQRSFVQIESADGVGEFMARVRNLHLYYMAATSRGALPPKWNGSLFNTEGDTRGWGTQFWVWTTEMLYFPLFAADAIDLTEPYFDMYRRHLPACERAAQQRWGVTAGAFYPETTPFDGPVVLSDEVAQEVQDLLLGRKPHTQLSEHANAQCIFDGHLRVTRSPHDGRYTYISHVISSGSELAIQAWWRYRYTGDTEWLHTHAYPLLRGTVEFYRHLVRKDADGLYHLHGTNAHEDFWGVKDSIMDLAAIRGTTPLAIRAAEILELDTDLRARWRGLLDELAPYALGSDRGAKALSAGALADDVWAAGHLEDVDCQHNPEDVWLNPVFPFEDWTLETRQPALDQMVQKILDLAPRHLSVLGGAQTNTAIRTPIAAVRAGRGEELPLILASYYAAFRLRLPNGMSLFEGPQAHSIEHLGCLTTVLQEGLLQSVSPRPGQPEIVNVFPAWPKAWNASFRLLARGGFLVTATFRHSEVAFVELESRLGETCQLRNPWKDPCLVTELGGDTKELEGEILRFDTERGKRYRVLPKGAPQPAPEHLSSSPTTEPASYALPMPDGTTVHRGTLGRRA